MVGSPVLPRAPSSLQPKAVPTSHAPRPKGRRPGLLTGPPGPGDRGITVRGRWTTGPHLTPSSPSFTEGVHGARLSDGGCYLLTGAKTLRDRVINGAFRALQLTQFADE